MTQDTPVTFDDLGLPTSILESLKRVGFDKPTAIQAQSVPVALRGSDLLGCAQTGSGKTAAFTIPMLAHLLKNPRSRVLVMTPTRELAEQVAKVVQTLGVAVPNLRTACLIGGTSMQPQLRNLSKHPRIIVATPGRLNDHLDRGSLELKDADFLVLDEADRMLDMGFAPQIERAIAYMPAKRQTLLFSATFPAHLDKLIRKYMSNPERVIVHRATEAVKTIKQESTRVSQHGKFDLLVEQLQQREGTVLVFARTKGRTEKLAKQLYQVGLGANYIHGGLGQGQRRKAIEGFREGRYRILVATDVAARGLDIPEIGHVVNYDLPMVAEDFIHRIGRTGRAGAEGHALSFVSPDEEKLWSEIGRLTSTGEAGQGPQRQTGARPDGAPRPGRFGQRSGGGQRNNGGMRNNRREREQRDFGGERPQTRVFGGMGGGGGPRGRNDGSNRRPGAPKRFEAPMGEPSSAPRREFRREGPLKAVGRPAEGFSGGGQRRQGGFGRPRDPDFRG